MRTVLTDIEGTTSSISFVKDVLFPYARRALPGFVAAHGREPGVRRWLDAVAAELGGACRDELIVETLQGLVWADGYGRADFTAHVYPDTAPALRRWHEAGHRLAVYSSGSVPAQKLLFGHTDAGDLSPLFDAWFDTEVGGKREVDSYRRIAERLSVPAGDIVFLSDVVAELDAARTAGLRTVLVDRREDYPQPRLGADAGDHRRVESFATLHPDAV